ncbi:MAG TPA: hypothetical protein VF543_16260 [Pyrinomonadaceae bacterium]|jgi:hypothetical protein
MQAVTQRETLKSVPEILSYQHDRLLNRYSIDYSVSIEESRRCFEALKEFMVVCAVKPGYKVTSDPIDRMWHTFLLFTKDYRTFCEDYLGMFINHEPFEHPTPTAYLETRAFAQEYFGRLDAELWPIEAKGDCSSGCGE